MKIPALFVLVGLICITGCKTSTNTVSDASYRKYVTGADETKGMLFFFKVSRGQTVGDLQSVYVNNIFVPNSRKLVGDTLEIEANVLYTKPNRAYDPEHPNERGKPKVETPLFNASTFSATLVFLKEGKLDSIAVKTIEPLKTNEEALIQ